MALEETPLFRKQEEKMGVVIIDGNLYGFLVDKKFIPASIRKGKLRMRTKDAIIIEPLSATSDAQKSSPDM